MIQFKKMRMISIKLALLLLLLPSVQGRSQHIVLDLDWTLLYQNANPNVEPEGIIRYGNEVYRL